MEDMATGEIRLSILWEWVHKGALLTEDDHETGCKKGEVFTKAIFARLLDEEYNKLLKADNRDVHEKSKTTSLPIIYEMTKRYIDEEVKIPWYIDLLNINLNNHDLDEGKRRIDAYIKKFRETGQRITENLDYFTIKKRSKTCWKSKSANYRNISPVPGLTGFNDSILSGRWQSSREPLPTIIRWHERLRKVFSAFCEKNSQTKHPVTTFGPYSPGQAVTIKRAGIEGIYLGGWATSAKGSINEDPGADLASYPLSQVPDEAASIVRALLTADRNQKFFRSRMTKEQRAEEPGN